MPLPTSRGDAVPSFLLLSTLALAGMGCVSGVVDEYGTRILVPDVDAGRVPPRAPGASNPAPAGGAQMDARPAGMDTRRNNNEPARWDAAPPPPPVAPPGGCTDGSVPAAIVSMLGARCQLCHGNPPLPTVPGTLLSYDDLARPSKTDPARTMAEMALARIRSTAMPMPPLPGSPVPEAEAKILETWIESGMPLEGCAPPTDGGMSPPRSDAGAPAPAAPNVFNTPPVCTSKRNYTGGNNQRMRPGDNCLGCHGFEAAGTVYPTAHEPRWCYGANGDDEADGATVVVTDSMGRTSSAAINSVGNFIIRARLSPPLRAKVVFQGRERVMIGMVPSGACNRCHSEDGTTTVNGGPKAPGRIVLP